MKDIAEKIKSWEVPIWHSHFGNPAVELSLLKSLCLYISSINSNFEFELDCFEEGYMNVAVLRNQQPFLELNIVDVESNKIGLFFENGQEAYIYKIEDIINYLD